MNAAWPAWLDVVLGDADQPDARESPRIDKLGVDDPVQVLVLQALEVTGGSARRQRRSIR